MTAGNKGGATSERDTGGDHMEEPAGQWSMVRVFLVMVAVGLVPLTVISFFMYSFTRQAAENSAMEYVKSATEMAALTIDSYMTERVHDNVAWAELEVIKQALQKQDVREQATAAVKGLAEPYGAYELAVLLDADGLAVSSSSPRFAGTSFAEVSGFKPALQGKLSVRQANYSEIVKESNPEFKGWTLCIAVPVKGAGKVTGVLMSFLKRNHLEKLVAKMPIARIGEVYVVDASKGTIVHPNRSISEERATGYRAELPILDVALANKEDHLSFKCQYVQTMTGGIKVMGLAHLKPHGRLPDLGWTVAVEVDASELPMGPAQMTRLVILNLTVVIGVVVVAILCVRSGAVVMYPRKQSPAQSSTIDGVHVEVRGSYPDRDASSEVTTRLDAVERSIRGLTQEIRALRDSLHNKPY